jgi:hypothetical protein
MAIPVRLRHHTGDGQEGPFYSSTHAERSLVWVLYLL